MLVDELDWLASDQIGHGGRDVEYDRVGILNVLRVNSLNEWPKTVQVGQTWQIYKSQVEEVLLIDTQVDWNLADFATNLGKELLLLVNHRANIG